MNPVVTLPGLNPVIDGLNRKDTFVVVFDTHFTETCDYANVVLPAATFFEKDDVIISDSHRYTRYSRKAIEPLGESRAEVDVTRELAVKIGFAHELLLEDPVKALGISLKNAFENGNFDDFLSGKIMRIVRRKREDYQTPSKKIEFYSTIFQAEPFPTQLPIDEDNGFLTLLNSAQSNWTHSQFRDVYGVIPREVTINPRDAIIHGIENWKKVELYNEYGEICLKSKVSDEVGEGFLWSPRPLIDSHSKTQNSLVPNERQSIGGGPLYNSIRVRIRKIE